MTGDGHWVFYTNITQEDDGLLDKDIQAKAQAKTDDHPWKVLVFNKTALVLSILSCYQSLL